jgi:hypothetical protein
VESSIKVPQIGAILSKKSKKEGAVSLRAQLLLYLYVKIVVYRIV